MKTYTADDAEAARLAALPPGEETLLVIPIEPQPKMGLPKLYDKRVRAVTWQHPDDTPNKRVEVAPGLLTLCSGSQAAFSTSMAQYAPFSPGDVVGVKEAIRWLHQQPSGLPVYKADTPADIQSHFEWRVPDECPDYAIRTNLHILSIEAQMVRGITPSEVKQWLTVESCIAGRYATFKDMAADEWHRRHPNLPFETAWAWFYKARKEQP